MTDYTAFLTTNTHLKFTFKDTPQRANSFSFFKESNSMNAVSGREARKKNKKQFTVLHHLCVKNSTCYCPQHSDITDAKTLEQRLTESPPGLRGRL